MKNEITAFVSWEDKELKRTKKKFLAESSVSVSYVKDNGER